MATKVALITASSAGLGAAIAKTFATDFRVVVNYFSRREKADEVVEAMSSVSPNPNLKSKATEPRFHVIQADVSDRSQVQKMIEETVSVMGRLDVVVSNAGWTKMTNFMDLNDNVVEGDWDRCFNVNVKSHLWLMHAARPHLEKNEQGGAFLLTSSVAGVKPSGSSLAYSVTKAAQLHLMKGLALICGPNVAVNAISPGLMMTEWGMKFPESKVTAATEKTVLKRLATVEVSSR